MLRYLWVTILQYVNVELFGVVVPSVKRKESSIGKNLHFFSPNFIPGKTFSGNLAGKSKLQNFPARCQPWWQYLSKISRRVRKVLKVERSVNLIQSLPLDVYSTLYDC